MDVVEIPAQDGDLVTTLDADIQKLLKRALREKLMKRKPNRGGNCDGGENRRDKSDF